MTLLFLNVFADAKTHQCLPNNLALSVLGHAIYASLEIINLFYYFYRRAKLLVTLTFHLFHFMKRLMN